MSMGVDHVSGSEPEEEDWEDVDGVRRDSTCYKCEMMEHFAREFGRKGKGRGKGAEASTRYAKGRAKTMKGAGRRGSGISRVGDTEGSAARAVQSGTSRQSADGESLASRGKMPTAEEVEDNLSQRRMEKSEECESLRMWWNSKNRKKALAALGTDPSGT